MCIYAYPMISMNYQRLSQIQSEKWQVSVTSENTVSSCISKYEHGKLKWTRYRRVVIVDE